MEQAKSKQREKKPEPKADKNLKSREQVKHENRMEIDEKAIQKLKLVAVAYSYIEREWFPTDEAYQAELEVIDRARQVVETLEKLGVNAKAYPADQYFFTNLLVDDPDLIINLVDTLRGKDSLQTSVPAALELANIPYTGAGMQGLVIGNNRNLFKQLLISNHLPTPEYQYIPRKGTKIKEELGLPLIVKLNESGGSVGIDNNAIKESLEDAQAQVNDLIGTYHLPVIVEQYIEGDEITAVVFEDSARKHTYLAHKDFHIKPDGKHNFTSAESYHMKNPYTYSKVKDEDLANRIVRCVEQAFTVLHERDYAKFDIRVDCESGQFFITDANPNTAFGPSMGLPMTEIMALHGIPFDETLAALISKHAKKIQQQAAG